MSWIRENNKKILAVFAALLMVVFILPSTLGQGDRNPIIAHYNGGSLRVQEQTNLREQWRTATGLYTQSRGQPEPIAAVLASTGYPGSAIAATAISKHPDTFPLLVKEAQAMGLHISDEQLDQTISKIINMPTNPRDVPHARESVRSLLLVDAAYRRAGAAIKVSQPVAQRETLRRAMSLKVALVDFTADTLKAAVPAPSEEQVKAHFEKYADTLPGKKTAENPHGFGYKVPDRVKLQYLTLDPAQVRHNIMAQKQPYEWEVQARKYYIEHPAEFAAVAPATTEPTTTAPATRPFAEVKEDAINRVVQPEVDRVVKRISDWISERVATDFENFRKQHTDLAAAPTDAGYASYAYLEQLAQDVQKQFGILPTVQRLEQDWLTGEHLAALPDIGNAWGNNGNLASVATSAAPFVDSPTSDNPRLFEFARPLSGGESRQYFPRITAADGAHRRTELAEVRDRVVEDIKLQAGYEKAKQEATAMLEQAKTTTLQSTARAAGRTVINAGPIRLPPPNQIFFAPIEGYDPGFESQDRFMRDVFGLLNSETHDSSGVPVGVVEMPESGKVAVVTITEGTTPFPVDRADIVRSAIANSVRHDAETTLQTDWFSYTNVAKRIGYKPLHESEEERPEEVAQK